MAGGIDITTGAGAALADGVAIATVNVVTGAQERVRQQSATSITRANTPAGPYRSPIQNKAATYSLLVPINPAVGELGSGDFNLYVFDAVKVANYRQGLSLTKAPLQTGLNISYHAIKRQAEIVLEIGMSDAMDAYHAGMWTGAKSKSISTFQKLQDLMSNRVLMTLSTRQNIYTNVMLVDIISPETNETITGLKATLVFEQLFLVGISTKTALSARPNATDETQLAQVQPVDPSNSLAQQHTMIGANPLTNIGQIGLNGVLQGGQASSGVVQLIDGDGNIIPTTPDGPLGP